MITKITMLAGIFFLNLQANAVPVFYEWACYGFDGGAAAENPSTVVTFVANGYQAPWEIQKNASLKKLNGAFISEEVSIGSPIGFKYTGHVLPTSRRPSMPDGSESAKFFLYKTISAEKEEKVAELQCFQKTRL